MIPICIDTYLYKIQTIYMLDSIDKESLVPILQ